MDIVENNSKGDKPIIGITLGDINGIGPEVVIKALSDPRLLNHITPVVYGSTKVLSFYRKMMNLEDFQYSQIKHTNALNSKRINVVNCWNEMVDIKPGEVTPEAGKCAYLALEQAMKHLKEDQIDALVTAPINKKNIQNDDFQFIGHTEYITRELGVQDSLMMMVAEETRIGVVTAHIPLKDVNKTLNKELVERKLKIMLKTLKNDYSIEKPRIAMLGVNPHAGEDGLLGDEEEQILVPVIADYRKKGQLVFGPYPADGFFGNLQYQKFDGILAMYHDQGLIPFKLLCFESGVNFTAGIPKVRTSPDHGTAYSIAGKDMASASSIRAAIYLASRIVKNRAFTKSEVSI